MCNILMSIQPQFVKEIMDGKKIYEYRKVKCRHSIDKIFIYATKPIMKIVGEATVESVIEGIPDDIWKETYEHSGITEDFFRKYYDGCNNAVVYKLSKIRKYKHPKKLSDYNIKTAPQSFVYIR